MSRPRRRVGRQDQEQEFLFFNVCIRQGEEKSSKFRVQYCLSAVIKKDRERVSKIMPLAGGAENGEAATIDRMNSIIRAGICRQMESSAESVSFPPCTSMKNATLTYVLLQLLEFEWEIWAMNLVFPPSAMCLLFTVFKRSPLEIECTRATGPLLSQYPAPSQLSLETGPSRETWLCNKNKLSSSEMILQFFHCPFKSHPFRRCSECKSGEYTVPKPVSEATVCTRNGLMKFCFFTIYTSWWVSF